MKEETIIKRKNRGSVVKMIDRLGNVKYILFDKNGDFVKESPNANILMQDFWKQ